MAEIAVEIKIENEKMQECVNEALYEYKTKSGLTVAECVERQIPKKPMHIERITFNDVYECPCCKKRFTGTSIAKYCYHCGQALDWA